MTKQGQPGKTLWLLTCEKCVDFPAHMRGLRGRYQLPDGAVRWLVEGESDLDALHRDTPGLLSIEVVGSATAARMRERRGRE